MRTIGMLVGIPDADQPSVRAQAQRRHFSNKPGEPLPVKKDHYFDGDMFADYVALAQEQSLRRSHHRPVRASNSRTKPGSPSQTPRTSELLIFLAVIAGAGVETTGRLFGWMGKVLAEHPDQRQEPSREPPR